MAILEKEVEIFLNPSNVKHYEKLGYEIPKVKDKRGIIRVPNGTKILVKIEELPKKSHIKLTKICDECGKHIPNQIFANISVARERTDGKDRCFNCAQAYSGNVRKENVEYEDSFEYCALKNGQEYLISEFSDKNDKTPKEISYANHEKYIWECPKYKHEYQARIYQRTRLKSNCPYCAGQKVLKGFNDLWTTHPHIAKLLKGPQRGYEITAGRNKNEDFICGDCGFEKPMIVNNVTKKEREFSCPECGDKVSYPEKFVLNFLKQLGVNFKYQKTFKWSENIPHDNPKLSGNKKYDFYIPSDIPEQCIIIETHGGQHNNKSFETAGGRTVEEEKENDKLKKKLAIKNGIKKDRYVELNCSKSEMEHIKNSIMSSRLATMFNLEKIDWLKCDELTQKSLVKVACELWNQGNKAKEIAKIIKLSRETVNRYLKRGKDLGWCDYDPKEERKLSASAAGKKTARGIVQLTLGGEFIKLWESMTQVQENLGINNSHISSVCKGKRNHAGGFRWVYKDEYEANNYTPTFYEIKNNVKRSVVQIDLDGNFINEYSSLKDATDEIGKKGSGISMACSGKTKTAYGFKWMYKKDYEGLLKL
ncbi:zinc-ribbon domain-containing protein [Neobacillus sp. C211]|uniref:zinc-ribbon domain-containing protein n=1 Tax=unclassified Neobacillus TaxID=2675272 RepID=UPI0039782799